MIMTIFDNLSEYWTSFASAPLGLQVVLGAGAVTAFGAVKNGWNLMFPVRWAAAKTLRGTAWLLHHTKNAATVASNKVDNGATVQPDNVFDTSSKKAYLQTLKHFNSKCNAKTLTREQLDLLLELGGEDVYGTNFKKEKKLYDERASRIRQAEADKVLARIEAARVAVVEASEKKAEDEMRKRITAEQTANSSMTMKQEYDALYEKATNPSQAYGYSHKTKYGY